MSEGQSSMDQLVRDNEALRRQVAALKAESERFKTTLYSIGDAVIAADADGNVVQMNHVAEALTGWSEVEATGRPTAEVFTIVNEETRREVESPVHRVLREGGVVGLANHTVLIARDGTGRPIADSGAPIRSEQGEVTGVVLVFRDQTTERATQRALRESEVRNRTIVASIPQRLFLKDRDGVYLAVNEPYATSLGSRPEQIVGQDDFAFYPAELAEKYRADDRAVMASGRVSDLEETYLAQGQEYWIHTIKAPVVDDAGAVTAVLGLFEDITERKRVEASLKDARDRLEEAQRAARLGNWEWDAVADEIRGSAEFFRLFDVAPAEMARFSQFVGRLHPDDRERVQHDVADALKQDRPYDTDYRVHLGDGGWRDLIARGRVFTGADGKAVRLVGTCLDITERKRAEAALRESEHRYRTLAESLPHLVWTCRADGPCDYLSPRWVDYTGIPEAEQLGYRWVEQLHPDDRERVIAEWSAVAPRGDAFDIEFRIRRADGVHRWFKTRAIPFRDDDGRLVKWFGSSTDIDDSKRAEAEIRVLNAGLEQRVADRTAQLEESNKELEAFSYSVSHDLRAPLRAINGFTGILADDYAPHLDPEGQRVCSVIREEAGRMGRLIDDLLAFSRLGRAEMSLSRIDMGTMAHSVFYELTTPESRARIDFQIGALPAAVGDPSLMRQMWMNLLANAVKFSSKRERAVITVSGEEKEGEQVYAVQDNGAGFDMRYAHKLFGVFQRLHSSKEFEGTGVGLALVQRVIRRHGGRVWADGETDGGATFHVALPQKGA